MYFGGIDNAVGQAIAILDLIGVFLNAIIGGTVARRMKFDAVGFILIATIAGFSTPSAQMAKEVVAAAFETPLQQGLVHERRVFHSLFATQDQQEGMDAFTEKRPPRWSQR